MFKDACRQSRHFALHLACVHCHGNVQNTVACVACVMGPQGVRPANALVRTSFF